MGRQGIVTCLAPAGMNQPSHAGWMLTYPASYPGYRFQAAVMHLLVGIKYKPRKSVTDGLRSYGVAQREVLLGVRHWSADT
jgi:hypothetical protein